MVQAVDERGPPEPEKSTLDGTVRMRSRPISHYLFFLILVGLVPALLFSGYLLVRTNTVQQEGLQSIFQSNTRSIVQVVEQEVSGMLTTLRVLATDPTLEADNLEAFHDRGRRALIGRGMNLAVVDSNLRQVFNTRADYGAQLPAVSGPDVLRRALQDRTSAVSGVLFSETSLSWVFFVALPVNREGREPLLLVLARGADSLARAIEDGRLPASWQVAIVDSTQTVLSSTDPALSAGGALPFTFTDTFRQGITEIEMNGHPFQIIREGSALTQWSVVAWTPMATISAPIMRSIGLLVIGGLTIGALAALVTWLVAGRITRSARRLSESARLLGAGQTVPQNLHPISEFAIVSTALGEAAHNRSEAESEIRLLMREVAHRSKNQLTVINAMVGQTAKNAASVDEFVDSFRRRITGLARSTDLLLANAARGIDFRALVESQLEPFLPSDPERVRLLGPTVMVDAQASQTLGMAIHELATNASKYGALSDEESRLEITWWRREGTLSLTWREYVKKLNVLPDPDRKGFGSVVLERMMGGTLDAEITRNLHDNGIEWHFAIPLERLRADGSEDEA
ncbi:sensor histidine kinase [Rhizobium sp. EC-SD404]|uniref:sensor histidine kinase n=1 Tax=Rhizobium sp. EC-SD404 TaxID=2038389 RepID=UPI0012531514|nr:sensor histidine kinase [Rhizobium sp. EC-SD404]VVT31771.1 Histidine kinase [Rhizobium sp. EC-SD404]